MTATQERVYELREYETLSLNRDELTPEEGELLWQKHRSRIRVEFPTPKTRGRWELTSLGWAGFLPITRELGLRLQPKVHSGTCSESRSLSASLEEATE